MSGVNSNNDVTLRPMPAAYSQLGAGTSTLYLYATKVTLPLDDLSNAASGMLKMSFQTNSTNTGIYGSTLMEYKHPGVSGSFRGTYQTVNITEFGEINTGFVSGSFSLAYLTNTTTMAELTLSNGSFTMFRITNNAAFGYWNPL